MKYLYLRGIGFQSLSLLGQFNKMKSWLVGAKLKKKERVNSTFLKVKEKKKKCVLTGRKYLPSFPVLLNIMGVKLATGNKIWKQE